MIVRASAQSSLSALSNHPQDPFLSLKHSSIHSSSTLIGNRQIPTSHGHLPMQELLATIFSGHFHQCQRTRHLRQPLIPQYLLQHQICSKACSRSYFPPLSHQVFGHCRSFWISQLFPLRVYGIPRISFFSIWINLLNKQH
jgi:hypothetical protein